MNEHLLAIDLKHFNEFAVKAVDLLTNARGQLSPIEWYLLMCAVCSLGEPTKTVFPKLSHSQSRIEGLGPTYRKVILDLPKEKREKIQDLYRHFIDSLSYGNPSYSDLHD